MPPRAHTKAHRSERLEPYEGKLSRTVLRGERAGNSPLPLGQFSFYDFNCNFPFTTLIVIVICPCVQALIHLSSEIDARLAEALFGSTTSALKVHWAFGSMICW